jgi:hypothetical protein
MESEKVNQGWSIILKAIVQDSLGSYTRTLLFWALLVFKECSMQRAGTAI